MMKDIALYNERFKDSTPQEIVGFALDTWGSELIVASSLGAEDQVLTHMAVSHDSDARVFVLDTGRLHPETYDVLAETRKQLSVNYEIYFPDAVAVEEMVSQKGINLFYDSVDNRKTCCGVRKVEPLKRALSTGKAWITGLRREQSVTRTSLDVIEWDAGNNMVKINPLASWSEEQVWDYLKANDVPTNTLHDKGFPSIGCAPCTRAIKPGEDVRAGRWWWETPEQKECGLHVVDGKLVRKSPSNTDNKSDSKGATDGPFR